MSLVVGYPDHMSLRERWLARCHLGLGPEDIVGPLTGTIVGECPGKSTDPRAPLFPHPRACAGGRLLDMSGMKPGHFLGRTQRINVIDEPEHWSDAEARQWAMVIKSNLEENHRVILLGARVAAAFGLKGYWQLHEPIGKGIGFVCVPHPSGKNLVYNDENARIQTRATVHWAADVLRNPGAMR